MREIARALATVPVRQSNPQPEGEWDMSGIEALSPQLYRVEAAGRVLSMSRTVIYELIRSGRLRSVWG